MSINVSINCIYFYFFSPNPYDIYNLWIFPFEYFFNFFNIPFISNGIPDEMKMNETNIRLDNLKNGKKEIFLYNKTTWNINCWLYESLCKSSINLYIWPDHSIWLFIDLWMTYPWFSLKNKKKTKTEKKWKMKDDGWILCP